MITNNDVTIYHKVFNESTRLEEWQRFNYENVWFFGGKGARLNKGFENANDVKVRISYEDHNGLDINNFKIGDIIVKGTLDYDINTQQDLKNQEVYNITSINNNNFGINQHIHIEGR